MKDVGRLPVLIRVWFLNRVYLSAQIKHAIWLRFCCSFSFFHQQEMYTVSVKLKLVESFNRGSELVRAVGFLFLFFFYIYFEELWISLKSAHFHFPMRLYQDCSYVCLSNSLLAARGKVNIIHFFFLQEKSDRKHYSHFFFVTRCTLSLHIFFPFLVDVCFCVCVCFTGITGWTWSFRASRHHGSPRFKRQQGVTVLECCQNPIAEINSVPKSPSMSQPLTVCTTYFCRGNQESLVLKEVRYCSSVEHDGVWHLFSCCVC